MSDSPIPKELKDDLQALNDAAETARKKQDWHSAAQVLIALLAIASTVFASMNTGELERVKASQEQLRAQQEQLDKIVSEQQVDATISTSVLHETMLILDTPDAKVRKQKVVLHTLLLTALANQEEEGSGEARAATRAFYTKLLATLPEAIDNQSDAQELTQYTSNELATKAATAPNASPNASPGTAAAVPVSVTVSPAGEAVQRGPAKGWDYDVFWCVKSTPYPGRNANEAVAEKLFLDLVGRQAHQTHEEIGRVRLRRLPELVNQSSPGYHIQGDHIAIHSTRAKINQATQLKAWAEESLRGSGSDRTVQIDDGAQGLPFYLSLFVCTES